MTRPLGTIYDDLIDLLKVFGETTFTRAYEYLTYAYFSGHKGDTQIVDNNLLIGMYNELMNAFDYLYKDTTDEVYSPDTLYVFDTHWWDFTGSSYFGGSGQVKEALDFYNDGYEYSYRRNDFSNYTGERWYIDENNQFKKLEACFLGTLIYDETINKIPDEPTTDLYRLEDLYDWSSGKFFDPSCVTIETKKELDDWLDAFDSILTIAKGLKPKQERIVPTTTAHFTSSDLLEISSKYSEETWYDDLTGEIGTIIKQQINVENESSLEEKSIIVYSEDRTITVEVGADPETGEPIYGSFTYNQTDPETGISFGTTAEELYTWAVDNFTETYGEVRRSSYPRYSYYTVDTNGVTGYADEYYQRNMSDTIKFIDNTIIDKMKDIEGSESSFPVVQYLYYDETPFPGDYNNNITKELWESELLFLSENIKTPSLGGSRFVTTESILEMTYDYPEFGTETTITYGAIFGEPYAYIAKFTEDVDLTRYTIHELLPPE